MASTAHIAAPLALAAVLAGCAPQPETGDAHVPPAGTGRLVIREARAAAPRPTEGSLGFLRISRAGAQRPVIDGRARTAAPGEQTTLFNRRLPAGTYHVVAYQRLCDGNCGYLDAPSERCDATVNVSAGGVRRLTLVVTPGTGCLVQSR
jgi:hypothetical protein